MKIPKIRQLPSGTWTCQLRIDGRSISVTDDSREACERKAIAYKARLITPEDKAKRLTVKQAIDNYIKERENVLSPSTVRGYRAIQRTRFQRIQRKQIRAVQWQRVISDEAKLCAPKTLRNAWAFMRSVLRDNGIQPPNVRLPQVTRKDKPFLDPEQIPVFLAAIHGHPCEIPALLALSSLRRSEIAGLTWDHVDLANNRIHVIGAVVHDVSGKLVYKSENKNATSRRTVPIMIPQLRAALSAVPDKTGAVCKCHPNSIYRWINKLCAQNGLPLVGVHGLRHSFASIAYHVGMSEKETMQIGGWSDNQTMHSVYTHLAERDRIKAENKLAAFFSDIENAKKC